MSSRYHDLIQRHCLPLLDLCARSQDDVGLEALSALATRILGMSSPSPYPIGGSSDLTEIGAPLMARTCGRETTMMGDVGWRFVDPDDRLMATRAVFSEMVLAQKMQPLQLHYNRLMAALLTCEQDALYRGQSSVISIGTDLGATSCILNARVNMFSEFDSWQFLHTWCQDILPAHQDRHAHWFRSLRAARFVPHSVSVGHRRGALYAAIELSRHHGAENLPPMRALPAIAGLVDDRLHSFLTAMHEMERADLSDERLRLEIELEAGQLRAIGMSFAMSPRQGPTDWLEALERRVSMSSCAVTGLLRNCSREVELARPVVRRSHESEQPVLISDRQTKTRLLSSEVRVSRVGIVIAQHDTHEACCELEYHADTASLEPLHRIDREVLERRMKAARESLVSRQRPEGQWPGLESIPFGGSATFVTAFSALALAHTGKGAALATEAARRGAQWLDIMRGAQVGWGLGPHIGADVMTSALVMRLFEATTHVISPQDRDWLLGQWSVQDGGFRFSEGPLHWGDVQPDVTALAWPLLDEAQRRARRTKFHEYLAVFAPSDGVWPSYWWTSPYFSTYFHLALFDEDDELRDQFFVDVESLEEALAPRTSTFAVAWACACAVRAHADDLAMELGQILLARQQIDGGWRGQGDLRMTSPSCAQPWEEARGELVVDTHGCLTTASALWALSELATLCQAREDLHYL